MMKNKWLLLLIKISLGLLFLLALIVGTFWKLDRPVPGIVDVEVFINNVFYAQAVPKAFPGAVGYATETRHAYGCFGSPTIYKVTNLNASGAGSFQGCWTNPGPTICVFETSGLATVNDTVRRGDDCLWIAGETAPSPGFFVRNTTLRHETKGNHADKVLVRHIGIFPTEASYVILGQERDVVTTRDATNIIYDSILGAFSIDEFFESRNNSVGTVSNSIFTYPLNNSIHSEGSHNYGMIFGTGSTLTTAAFSMVNNVVAHAAERHPRVRCTNCEVINNVSYNSTGNTGSWIAMGDSTSNRVMNLDVRGNYFKCGVNSGACAGATVHSLGINSASKICVDNTIHRNHAGTAGRRITNSGSDWNLVNNSTLPSSLHQVSCPGPASSGTITPISPDASYQRLIIDKNVGMRPWDMNSGNYNTVYNIPLRTLEEIRTGTGAWVDTSGAVGVPVVPVNARALTLSSACGAQTATCLGTDSPHGLVDAGPFLGYSQLEKWVYTFHAGVAQEVIPSETVFKVQRCSLDILAGATTNSSCNFTPVADTSKAIVQLDHSHKLLAWRAGGASWAAQARELGGYVELLSASSIRVTRSHNVDIARAQVSVLEYTGPDGDDAEFVVRDQGLFTMANGVATYTTPIIADVSDINKLVCMVTGLGTDSTGRSMSRVFSMGEAVNDSGIKCRFTRTISTDAVTGSYSAVDFSGADWGVKCGKQQITTAGSDIPVTLPGAYDVGDWANTMIISSFKGPNVDTSSTWRDFGVVVRPGASTTSLRMYAHADSNVGVNREVSYCVVSHPELVVAHKDSITGGQANIPMTSQTVSTYTHAAVNSPQTTMYSLVSYPSGNSENSNMSRGFYNYYPKNSTTVEFFTGRTTATAGYDSEFALQVMDFANIQITPDAPEPSLPVVKVQRCSRTIASPDTVDTGCVFDEVVTGKTIVQLDNNKRQLAWRDGGVDASAQGREVGGYVTLTGTTQATLTRSHTTDTARGQISLTEYIGPSGGSHEFLVRGQGTASMATTVGTVDTATISGVVDINKLVCMVTGLGTDTTSRRMSRVFSIGEAVDSSGIKCRFTRTGTTDAVVVSYSAVEFTGASWTVGCGKASVDTAGADIPVTLPGSMNVGNWNTAMILSSFRGPNNDIDASWNDFGVIVRPGASTTTLRLYAHGASVVGAEREVSYCVVKNPDLVVEHQDSITGGKTALPMLAQLTTSYTHNIVDAPETTWYILTSYPSGDTASSNMTRGWYNYYPNNSTSIALYLGRTHTSRNNPFALQIVNFAGLLSPEIPPPSPTPTPGPTPDPFYSAGNSRRSMRIGGISDW